MWLMFLSLSQLRYLSIVINILHTINYIYLRSLSMSHLSIIVNILNTINYIYVKSLSMPQLRSLSIAFNTMHRDLSHDSCFNPCLCHVLVGNCAYQRKRLWRGDSNPWTESLLTMYIVVNFLYTINYSGNCIEWPPFQAVESGWPIQGWCCNKWSVIHHIYETENNNLTCWIHFITIWFQTSHLFMGLY